MLLNKAPCFAFLLILSLSAKLASSLAPSNMKVFVAGGTGTIGQALVPKLIEAGHEVTVASRSESKFDAIEAMGAKPVLCDILDRETLEEAVATTLPQVVLHQVTAFSSSGDPFGETNRLRTEGTANLIHAARQAKTVNQFIAQSVAFLCDPNYNDGNDDDDEATETLIVTNEETPMFEANAPPAFQPIVEALVELEKQVLELDDDNDTDTMKGTVLRYGHFYGEQTFYGSSGFITAMVQNGQYPIVADGRGAYSFVSVEDAATATVQAIAKRKPGIYTIVDDSSVPVKEWVTKYAEIVGGPAPAQLSNEAAINQMDPFTYFFMTQQKGASNRKAKAELDWSPKTPTWSDGFQEILSPPVVAKQ